MIHSPNAQNPCTRHCCLDDNDVCLGCFRKLEEILNWKSMSEKEQQDLFEECLLRREKNEQVLFHSLRKQD
ncbi:DUF1289 domain-containing protein [Vibrio sonorensis]|uniref:DUF1289 domain-containing protein n=1 Tax=Vibrio sonorensis TaxID=1004316 RepID=UPI001C2F14E0|nr:DUF1289 domain-containing protein [Vibrio sonorensis]